jgi:cytochrome c peroxidase
MKTSSLIIFGVSALLCASCAAAEIIDSKSNVAELQTRAKQIFGPLPDKMPGAENDTPDMAALGKKLYFETEVSENRQMSCNTCHMVDENRAGVDNEATSLGVHGKRGDRNSPTTLNAGFHFVQFWDGRAKTLEDQAKGPVLNPVEMAMPGEAEVISRLSAKKEYAALFKAAFPKDENPISYDNFARAVAAFERTLITRDRFDDFMKGDDKALSAQELNGLKLFMDTGCVTCHTSPTIGGNSYQKLGVIHKYANTNDMGRIKVTGEEWDEMRFKVPSLRNIALTYPYFHDGQIPTLDDAIKTMARLQLGKDLSAEDAAAIKAFLQSLTDKSRKPAKPPAPARLSLVR